MSLLLRNLAVVDCEAEKTTQCDVRIRGGVIVSVNAIGAVPRDDDSGYDEVVDCEGRYALPGLTDTHIHLRGADDYDEERQRWAPSWRGGHDSDDPVLNRRLRSFLYAGVTSVFDAGNDPSLILGLRSDEMRGIRVSPRIYCAGALVTCEGGHAHQIGGTIEVRDAADGRARLKEYLSREPDIVKFTYDEHDRGPSPLIPILELDTLATLVDFCHENGHRVTVHIESELRAREAINAGADTLAHPVVQSPMTDEFVQLIAQRRIPVASTLAHFDKYRRTADCGVGYLDEGLYAACMSTEERSAVKEADQRMIDDPYTDWTRLIMPLMSSNIQRIEAAGGVIAAGSDLTSGPDFHRELWLLEQAGLSIWATLRAATLHAAAYLGRPDQMGSLRAGRVADVLILDEDPAADLANLTRIWRLYKAGEAVDRDRLMAV